MTQDSTTSEEKSSRSYWGFVLWPVAVVVLYVLSIGPLELAWQKDLIPRSVYNIHEPLRDGISGTPLEKPVGMYMHLWCPGRYRKDGGYVTVP